MSDSLPSNTSVEAKDDRARLINSLTPQSSPYLTRKPLGVKEAIELSSFSEHHQPSTCLSQLVCDGDIDKLRSFSAIDLELESLDHLDTNEFAALHYAAQLDRVEILNLLLDYGANKDVQGRSGVTPLHVASKYGSEKVIPVLLRHGADPSLKTKYGCTALHIAVRKGNIVIVQFLLRNKTVIVNAQDACGYTPLHDACSRKNYQVCLLLLKYGAAIDIQTVENVTPIQIAATYGDVRILELLLDKAAEQGQSITSPVLQAAVVGGNTEAVQAILRTGVGVNQSKPNVFAVLHAATIFGELTVIESLISKGADVEARDHALKTPLHWASMYDRTKVIQILLQAGAGLDVRDGEGLTPFLSAVRAGRLGSAKFLLESGADMRTSDSSSKNCLHVAIEEENLEMVDFLLQRSGLELINMVDKIGRAPLHYAVLSRNSEILEALIEKGCACLVMDENLKTPLHLAAEFGKTRNADKLLDACMPLVAQRDEMGRLALHYAAMNGRSKLCANLLGCSENIDTVDADQWTSLLWAAMSGCVEAVEVLLDKGASTKTSDTRGNTALHVAATHGHAGIILCLLDRGAPILVNNEGLNCLDYAIENQLYCAIRTIVHHRRWREVFDTRGKKSENLLMKLIDECPSAAEIILDKCIERGPNPEACDYAVTYNFRLLDPGPDDVSAKDGTRYFGLAQLVSCSRRQLIQHPVARKLLDTKWKSFGFPVYIANLFMYLCFIILLTIFMQTQRVGISLLQGSILSVADYKVNNGFNRASNIAGLVFVVLHMLKELTQMYMLRLRYFFSFQNLLEWVIYVTGFVYLIAFAVDSQYLIQTDLPWQCGTTCIFLAYMNLIFQFRLVWFIGLYVTMFIEVFKTLLQVMSMAFMFILAYSLVFFILFKEQASFVDFGRSIVTTTVMTVGELNYEGLLITSLHGFTNRTGIVSHLVPFPFISNAFFYIFLLTMPIVLMNLLVGLAVGDIEAIRKTSNFRRTATKIEFLTEAESRYPGFITRWLYKPELVEKPNIKITTKWRFWLFGSGPKKTFNEDQEDSLSQRAQFRYEQLDKSVYKTKKRVKSLATLLEKQNRLLVALTTRRGLYQEESGESTEVL